MNKRQWKKYRKRNYCWTYKEHKQGNIYFFMWWENKSGKSKVLIHDGSKGRPWITRTGRIYGSELLRNAYEQYLTSDKGINGVFYGEFDHPSTQSFEIQTVGRLIP